MSEYLGQVGRCGFRDELERFVHFAHFVLVMAVSLSLVLRIW